MSSRKPLKNFNLNTKTNKNTKINNIFKSNRDVKSKNKFKQKKFTGGVYDTDNDMSRDDYDVDSNEDILDDEEARDKKINESLHEHSNDEEEKEQDSLNDNDNDYDEDSLSKEEDESQDEDAEISNITKDLRKKNNQDTAGVEDEDDQNDYDNDDQDETEQYDSDDPDTEADIKYSKRRGADTCLYKYAKKEEESDDESVSALYNNLSEAVDKTTDFDVSTDIDEILQDDKKDISTTISKPEDRETKPVLTKYERVRIIGDRAKQISQGAKPMLANVEKLHPKEIAKLELEYGVNPFKIIRTLPDGTREIWNVNELEIVN